MTILEFLLARIEAEELFATAHLGGLVPANDGFATLPADTTQEWRMLAACEVIRNVIDLAFENEQERDASDGCGHSAQAIRAGECRTKPEDFDVLRLAALRYAGHPSYNAAWALATTPTA